MASKQVLLAEESKETDVYKKIKKTLTIIFKSCCITTYKVEYRLILKIKVKEKIYKGTYENFINHY